MENQKALTDQELDLVAKAFATEAMARFINSTRRFDLIDQDEMYRHFSHDRQEYQRVLDAIVSEMMAIQSRFTEEARLVLEKISVKYFQDRS